MTAPPAGRTAWRREGCDRSRRPYAGATRRYSRRSSRGHRPQESPRTGTSQAAHGAQRQAPEALGFAVENRIGADEKRFRMPVLHLLERRLEFHLAAGQKHVELQLQGTRESAEFALECLRVGVVRI